MGSSESKPTLDKADEPKTLEKKCSPCCVCKETRKARDECLFSNSEEDCKKLIEAHIQCMKREGFAVAR